MKFGKEIQSYAAGDAGWSPFYLDYKGLKKIINSLAKGRPLDAALLAAVHRPRRIEATEYELLPAASDESALLHTHRAAFFFKLERELEKINAFYLNKESELKLRLQNLIEKRKRLQDAVIQSGFHLNKGSSSFVALHEGFRYFERDLAKLQGFIDINATGFRKILKKWDKRSKSTTKELYLSRQVEVQPVFNRSFITELSDSCTANLQKLDQLSDSDVASLAAAKDPSADAIPGTGSDALQSQPQLDFLDDLEIALERAVTSQDVQSATGLLSALPSADSLDNKNRIQRLLWRMIAISSPNSEMIPTTLLDFEFTDDINGRSCMHEMARLGRYSLVELALAHGASPLAKDVYMRQPLHYAAMNGYHSIISLLLKYDALVEKDVDSQSPLSYAVINGHLETVSALLQNLTTEELASSDTLLHLASQYGHTDILRLLLSHHLPIVVDSAGFFPQHLAARYGHADCLRLLLELGHANLNEIDKYSNFSSLMHAASEGHVDCVKILLDKKARTDLQDDTGRTAVHWAAWRGHIDCLNLLLVARSAAPLSRSNQKDNFSPTTEMSTGSKSSDEIHDADVDLIPSLSLPPPIIPFRVYGHNYLDRKSLIQISLGHRNIAAIQKSAVTFLESDRKLPLKVVVSVLSDSSTMPHTCALANEDEHQTITFQIFELSKLILSFDLFPIHGSRMIGRALAQPALLSSASCGTRAYSLPVMDHQLSCIGEINFELSAITAFAAAELAPGGQLQTYWKSSAPQQSGAQAPQSGQVVASSLQGEYIKVVVQVTRDGVPVAWPHWTLPDSDVQLGVMDVDLGQLINMSRKQTKPFKTPDQIDARAWYTAISESMLPLEQLLKILPTNLGINIELRLPTASDVTRLALRNVLNANDFIDSVLTEVYNANKLDTNQAPEKGKSGRKVVFSSFNPLVATALNWKQPNYAVFFASYCGLSRSATEGKLLPANRLEADQRCVTLREAVKFAKNNNMLGVLLDSTIFKQVPSLVDATKDYGLLLVTFGTESKETLKLGVDAHMQDGVMHASQASQRFLEAV